MRKPTPTSARTSHGVVLRLQGEPIRHSLDVGLPNAALSGMFWFFVGILIVLIAAIFTVNTRGGGRWTFLPFTQQSRNDLRQEEFAAELELERKARGGPKDLAP